MTTQHTNNETGTISATTETEQLKVITETAGLDASKPLHELPTTDANRLLRSYLGTACASMFDREA
jgi:hypothetical protein